MVDIKSCEEIVYKFKKGSFGAIAWAKEIIAFKMLA